MKYRDKLKVYIPESVKELLYRDATMFEIYKRDSQIPNMNKFLSKLILGYYKDFIAEQQDYRARVSGILLESGLDKKMIVDTANKILKSTHTFSTERNKKRKSIISIKPTAETEGIIQSIVYSDLSGETLSSYFCRLLTQYSEKPIKKREQLIFHDNYIYLEEACKKNAPIAFSTIWNKEKLHEVIPFCLATGHDEMLNYLLCAEINPKNGLQEAKTFRLCRLTNIHPSRIPFVLTEEVANNFEKMKAYGPEYAINRQETTCVRLTEEGRKSYNRIYRGRPYYSRIDKDGDNYYFYFECSTDQILFYFMRFGAEAEIISPKSLRDKMSLFHQTASELYKQEKK